MLWIISAVFIIYIKAYFLIREGLREGTILAHKAPQQFLLAPLLFLLILGNVIINLFGKRLQRGVLMLLGGRKLAPCLWCRGNGCWKCGWLGRGTELVQNSPENAENPENK